MNIRTLNLTSDKWQIHPQATHAYLWSSLIPFQATNDWFRVLQLESVSLPWAIIDPLTKQVQVFAHWQTLLPKFNDGLDHTEVLIWPSTTPNIESYAWRYAGLLIGSTFHRKHSLIQTGLLIESLPQDLVSAIQLKANNTRSLESLLRYYTAEPDGSKPRAPARRAVQKIATERKVRL